MAIGNFDVTPAFERREQHEKIGCAVAFVLAKARSLSAEQPAAIGLTAGIGGYP
jgi:hypothetical protein